MESRQSYFERMRKLLDDLNIKISELELKMENATREFREKYKPEIDELKKMKHQVELKLNELKDPAKDAWNDIREGLDKAAVELNAALRNAFKRFNKSRTDNQ